MKGKILVALKTKYKTFGFGEKAFDGVADYLSKTITEESQIETAISGVEGLLKAFQGEVDFVRNEKSGLQKQIDELKTNTRENRRKRKRRRKTMCPLGHRRLSMPTNPSRKNLPDMSRSANYRNA